MKVAENNVWQKAGEDRDFLKALVWADTWRFILNGEEYETTSLPTWVLLHSVVSWHVEDKVLVIILGGEDENGEPENHSGTGAENSTKPV